jgi:hypothetical protein
MEVLAVSRAIAIELGGVASIIVVVLVATLSECLVIA